LSQETSKKESDNPHAPPWARRGVGRILGFLVFFAFFFGMLFLFNLYVLTRLFSMLELRHGIFFLAFTILSSLSFAAAMGLRTSISCLATKGYYYAAATWLGFLIFFMFASIVYDVAGWFVDFDRAIVAPAFIVATAVLVFVSLAIPYFVVLREIEIPSGKPGPGLKILHMSDIHVGATHGPESLGKLVRMANDAKPDLVLITGDLADSPMRPSDNPFAALDGLHAPAFFCIGNHEYYAGIEEVSGMLAKTKVRVLRNEAATVGDVQVIGLDYGGAAEVKEHLPRLPIDRSKYVILMFHQPDGFYEASAAGVDLMLSGHTHGGQFFPFTGINRLVWGREYRGLHKIGDMHLYTSTGAGTWGPPMRLGTRSEIALIKVNGRN
jgi:predicted MPP superfamily phosphohydrolase